MDKIKNSLFEKNENYINYIDDIFSKEHAMLEMYNTIKWILWKMWDIIPI